MQGVAAVSLIQVGADGLVMAVSNRAVASHRSRPTPPACGMKPVDTNANHDPSGEKSTSRM